MKFLLFAFALGVGLALPCAPAVAQSAPSGEPASLRGTVTNAATGTSLPLANIALEGTDRGVAADEAGFYRLVDIPPGTYTVVVSYLGYERTAQTLTLAEGEDRRLDLALRPADVEVGRLTVTGERDAVDEKDLGVERLSTSDIKRLPTVFEPDVFRALQLLPGVAAANDFSSGLYIRGGTPDQTLILLDRTTVYNPTHFFGLFSTFNPDAIRDVRLFKGGYPAEYGGRLGSVVDLYNKTGNREEVEGLASVGLLASRASLEGPHPAGAWTVSVRRSTLEPLLAALQNQDISGIPNSFYFFDVNTKITFDASERDRIAVSAYAGEDNLDFPFLDDASVQVAYGNRTASGTWTRLFSEQVLTNLTVTASRYFSRPEFEIGGTTFERINELTDLSARGDVEWDPPGAHRFKSGFWGGSFDVELGRTIDGQRQFSPQVTTGYAMAYVQDTWQPSPQWQVRAGLRGSYYTSGQHLRVEPRASVEYQPTDAVRLQAGYGRYYQHLTLISSELFTGIDTWLTTEDDVPPSYGDQFVLGVKTQLAGDVSLNVEAYYRTMRELFEIDPYQNDVAGQEYEDAFLFGDGAARGVEAKLERTGGRLNGFLAYTLGQTRRRFPGINTTGTLSSDGTTSGRPLFYPPKYDRRHDLRLVANYDFAARWRASAIFTYATGQAYTQPQSQYKLLGDPFDDTPRDVLVAPFNSERLPAYHRLDVGLSRVGRFFGFADYEVQVQLINAYNRSNTWFYFFEVEQNRVERNTVNQIPVPLPNVSLTLNF